MTQPVLLLIDLQMDYFPGGVLPLPNADLAVARAARILGTFRSAALPVVHIRHESAKPGKGLFMPGTAGCDFHPVVQPLAGETVLTKHKPNSFLGTGLEELLRGLEPAPLAVCGMMTSMCVDAGVRAASDLGFDCLLLHDACAAPDLEHNGVSVPGQQVHAAFVAALGQGYAQLAGVEELINRLG